MRPDAPFVAPEADARRVALLDWAESSELGALWSAEDGRWATQQARADAPADFRLARARHAARRLGERDERLAELLQRPLWSGTWPVAAGLVGVAAGLATDRLGGQQLNLLALPLWWVLALQLLGYGLLVIWATRPRRGDDSGSDRGSRGQALWRWLLTRRVRGRAGMALAHWWKLSAPLQGARAALLWHAGLLGLSLGLIAGLYGRALGHEFLIGWQSTYLDAAAVQRLADTLLKPAAWLTGLAVPDVAPLRHGALQAASALAKDWLHLLAATIALVALPRLALAAYAGLRCAWLARALPLSPRGGARDLRLLVLDPQRLWAGRLLGDTGERLASPEGDRLWVTVADTQPATPPTPWRARAWRRLTAAAPPAPAFDACLTAQPLSGAAAGWPAERRQLRALAGLWQPAQQPAWQRLLAAWEAPLLAREAQAQRCMAQTLARLGQPLPAPAAADPLASLRAQVAGWLQTLQRELAALYGHAPMATAVATAPTHLPHKRTEPLPTARNTVLGGALSGAASGLGADLASGGLTLGAGALVGAVVGGMAGAGLTEWFNRRQDRRTASIDIEPAEAAPLLAVEVLNQWQAQLGLALGPAPLRAAALQQPWATAFQAEPTQRLPRLQALFAQACQALLEAADAASSASTAGASLPQAHEPAWLAGASGLVGRALRAELPDAIALVRRPEAGARTVDYARPDSFAALPAPRSVYIALGTTLAQAGSRKAFRAVDFDAVLTVARAARAAGATHCAVVSALGADAGSRVFYNRVKGEAEAALAALGFERLVLARPSLLAGRREALGQPPRRGEAWMLALSRPVAGLIPRRWRPIAPERVARAMRLALTQAGPRVQVLESAAMQTLGAP